MKFAQSLYVNTASRAKGANTPAVDVENPSCTVAIYYALWQPCHVRN